MELREGKVTISGDDGLAAQLSWRVPAVDVTADNAAQSRLKDTGFPDSALRELGEHLDAGSSAIITLVTEAEAELVKTRLGQLGGVFIEHTLPAQVAVALTTTDAA